MAKKIMWWSMRKMVQMIVKILNSKFDCVVVIEGNRGLGKSTLAIHLQRRVAREFKKLGQSDKYNFNWRHNLIYTKKETKHFFHKWEQSGIADEMINVTFNRDFYDTEQKDIIKMINMNRDHRNFFVACVPQFQTLDNQIKNLCKLRITIVRRGLAIIQTPNRTIYVKDKWDSQTNEKIERDWVKKGIKNPHYSRLTTFRGLMRFPKLSDSAEAKYQEVKDKKRNVIAREEMGIVEENKPDPVGDAVQMLIDGKIRNGVFLHGLATAHGINEDTFRTAIRRELGKKGLDKSVSNYYWEKKAKDKESGSI